MRPTLASSRGRRRVPRPGHAARAITASVLAAAAAAALGLLATPARRHARPARRDIATEATGEAACPGARRCPYDRVSVLGSRAGRVLRSVQAVAAAPGGAIYVADQFSYVVRRFSARGRLERQWGSFGRGDGRFGAIAGLAVDGRGRVYVVDSSHDRVQVFDARGRFITSWGRHGSRPGEFHFGGGLGQDRPSGGAIAVRGPYAYVADTRNDRIQRFTLDGRRPTVWGGRGTGPGRFLHPKGLTATGRGIYVADDRNRRVQLLDRHGRFLAQAGGFGSGPGRFADPYGVAVGRNGHVYAADDNNNRIVELSPRLRYLRSWSSDGRGRPLSYVRAIAADGAGRLYVADAGNNQVEVFDEAGHAVRRWGVPGTGPGEFTDPSGVSADAQGGVLVVESFGSRSRILRFTPDLRFRASWRRGGNVILGRHFFTPTQAAAAPDGSVWVTDRDNGLVRHLSPRGRFLGALGRPRSPSAKLLRLPTGVALDAAGTIYVADAGTRRIRAFTPGGRPLSVWSSPPRGPRGAFALDRRGGVYVLDSERDRVVRFAQTGRLLASWGGFGTSSGRFRHPDGIAIDARGDVFVTDRDNARVQKFSATGRFLTAWGRRGTGPGEFSAPAGIAVDCRGRVLVADRKNNRVQVFGNVAAKASCARGRRS